jgi:UDP-N-acetylmuramoyl-tripeptide--D-alanyl-D-alanine ligase
LRLEPEDEVAVLEMGMNHAGEISALAKIAEPNWAVVSNVGPVHLEFFEDGIEGIARAKFELVEALPVDGIAFLNADDERVREFGNGLGDRAVLFGTSEKATVRAVQIDDHGLRGTEFELVAGKRPMLWPMILRMPGRHNVLNALAAYAVGRASGVEQFDAIGALERMRPGEKRGNVVEWRGAEIVNDTYNSNPKALEGMVEALKRTEAKRRIVVAGEMLELGAEGGRLHEQCGEGMVGVDVVVGVRGLAREIVVGARAKGVRAEFVETPEAAGKWLRENLLEGDVVLLKASRGVKLERALEALVKA